MTHAEVKKIKDNILQYDADIDGLDNQIDELEYEKITLERLKREDEVNLFLSKGRGVIDYVDVKFCTTDSIFGDKYLLVFKVLNELEYLKLN